MTVLLFAGESYYARGGMNDFQGIFGSEDEALQYIDTTSFGCYQCQAEWWQIIDKETLAVVSQSEAQAHGSDEDSYCPYYRE